MPLGGAPAQAQAHALEGLVVERGDGTARSVAVVLIDLHAAPIGKSIEHKALAQSLAQLVAGSAVRGDAPYKTRLQHAGEAARPGSYSLLLPDLGSSLVELVAAGTHTGLHRYSCAAASCTLLLDACHGTHDGGCPAANASTGADSDGTRNLNRFWLSAALNF